MLETAGQAIITHLETDTLPGMTPEDLPALQVAFDDYLNVHTSQASDQSAATSARVSYAAKVKEVSRFRRQVQYAVEAVWPVSVENAAIRVEFKLSPDRAMN